MTPEHDAMTPEQGEMALEQGAKAPGHSAMTLEPLEMPAKPLEMRLKPLQCHGNRSLSGCTFRKIPIKPGPLGKHSRRFRYKTGNAL
jgi:hypothetical protein